MGNDERETTNSGSVPKGTEDAVAWQPPATLPATLVLPDCMSRYESTAHDISLHSDRGCAYHAWAGD
jgi:hypothetical protein